jgi:hypothetical protein
MIADNPFFVLGLSTEASRLEIEREGQKLLGMIELRFADALTYATPLGPRPRDAEGVRAALAALRDPARRLIAELWARHAPPAVSEAPAAATDEDGAVRAGAARAMPRARARLGWGG